VLNGRRRSLLKLLLAGCVIYACGFGCAYTCTPSGLRGDRKSAELQRAADLLEAHFARTGSYPFDAAAVAGLPEWLREHELSYWMRESGTQFRLEFHGFDTVGFDALYDSASGHRVVGNRNWPPDG
jgi:hypothetical protein